MRSILVDLDACDPAAFDSVSHSEEWDCWGRKLFQMRRTIVNLDDSVSKYKTKIKNFKHGVFTVRFLFLILQKAKDLYCRILNIIKRPTQAL